MLTLKEYARKIRRKLHVWKNGQIPYVRLDLEVTGIPCSVYWPDGADYERLAYLMLFMAHDKPALRQNIREAVIRYGAAWRLNESGAFIINILDGLPHEEAVEMAKEGLCNVEPPPVEEQPQQEAPPEPPKATYIQPNHFLQYHRSMGNLSPLARGDD